MKKINLMLRKCRTLSRQLVRTSSGEHEHRSANARGVMWKDISVVNNGGGEQPQGTVLVGSTRKQYVIDSKYLNHPLVKALIEKSSSGDGDSAVLVISCEVVLFDHLLWMLHEDFDLNLSSDSLDELADFYYVN